MNLKSAKTRVKKLEVANTEFKVICNPFDPVTQAEENDKFSEQKSKEGYFILPYGTEGF